MLPLPILFLWAIALVTEATQKHKSWNKGDDAKLLALFEQHREDPGQGVDPQTEGSQSSIESIRSKHFSHIPYRNFRTLWTRKTSNYITNQTLNGTNKPDDMPPKKKTPATSTEASGDTKKPAAEVDVDGISDDLGGVSLGDDASPRFSIDQTNPFVVKVYSKNSEDKAEVEFMTLPLDKGCFIIKLGDDGMELWVTTATPEFFLEEKRMKKQMGDKFRQNDPRTSGHKATVQAIRRKKFNLFSVNNTNFVFGTPQKIKLPFKCEGPPEKEFVYMPFGHVNTKDSNNQDISNRQFVLIVTIVLKSAKKRIRKEKSGFAKICAALSQDSGESDIDYDTDDDDDANMAT